MKPGAFIQCEQMQLRIAFQLLHVGNPENSPCVSMAVSGTVTSYNPHKGWGFIECNGQGVFVNRRQCGGYCLAKGMKVSFIVTQGDKGQQATDVKVMVPPEEAMYHGEIKSFNPNKGYGFVGCEAFPGQDVFVLKSEIPGASEFPEDPLVALRRKEVGEKADGVQLPQKCSFLEPLEISALERVMVVMGGQKYQQMKQMAFYGGFKGFGKGKGKGKGPRVDPSEKVWIGGIPCLGDMGTEHMNQVGKTKWVEVFEGKGAGTGTAAYSSAEEVAQAIASLDGSALGGGAIQVDAWVKAPKEEAAPA
ncbi:unnamed protein product [Cladocopium goreaui]|uniref:Cold shock-like protein CspLB n=1 Tax=Cladocopium goreaui TaxID=2562237 RepID=A0A9P1D5F5_9DINO|nr:unnamed protein product [Cladocopium goreaui]